MSDSAAWEALTLELDLWAAEGRTATFWWRDDDAIAPTPALDRLRACASAAGIPIALAVIPAKATPELAAELRDWPSVRRASARSVPCQPRDAAGQEDRTRPRPTRLST